MDVEVFSKHFHFVEPKLLVYCTKRPEILYHYQSVKEAEFRENNFFDGNWKPYRSKKIDHKIIGNRSIIDANHFLANLHQ
jgi:hypothetical protein